MLCFYPTVLSLTVMPRNNAIAEFRALRAAGKTRFDTYEVEEAKDVYDELDEESYRKLVRARADKDEYDFVVDDEGTGGYVDDGHEVWDEERRDYDSYSEEEEQDLSKKKGSM